MFATKVSITYYEFTRLSVMIMKASGDICCYAYCAGFFREGHCLARSSYTRHVFAISFTLL